MKVSLQFYIKIARQNFAKLQEGKNHEKTHKYVLAVIMVVAMAVPAFAAVGATVFVTAPKCPCGTNCGAHLEVTREYISGFGTMYSLRWLIITQEMLFITTTG